MNNFIPPFDPLQLYKNFLINNNIYTDEIYQYGCKHLTNDTTIDSTNVIKIYRDNFLGENYFSWKDYYLKHSLAFKIFTRYAKEHNLYNKFIKNTNNRKILSFDFFNNFNWSKTNENFSFWDRESLKWLNLYGNIKKIAKNEKKYTL